MRKIILLTLALIAQPAFAVTSVHGDLIKWQPVILDVTGPVANESDISPNPFLDIRLDITLTSPSGESYVVPGFFAGDGAGVGIGNLWRVRFSANEAGTWRYDVSFKEGEDAAVLDDTDALNVLPSHGDSGTFDIAPRDDTAPGFLRTGRLEYIGEHYLKFADGPYFIKSGVDSPENFFGYAGFDNTFDQPGGLGTGILKDGVHHYTPHIDDFQTGDPLFTSIDTGIDSKGIIGAVNYLSSQGVNSIYFLPMNLGGDGRDTYPFISPAGTTEANSHYDVSKLFQWNTVLDHMQRKGIAAHVVLNEQEVGNTEWLDDGELGTTRKLFYRELIARFAYLNAVKWNLSEESRHGTERHVQFARFIRALDWANHPVGVHTKVNNPDITYDDLLGMTEFDITSIQFTQRYANLFTEAWRTFSARAGWPWVIDMDEIGPGGVGLTPENTDELRTWVLYPVYFSGGNIEWYFGYHSLPLGGDVSTEDFRTRERMIQFTTDARQFMEDELPFWEMQPDDQSLSGKLERDQVFSLPGNIYAVYLANGVAGRTLTVEQGQYSLSWFNPRNGTRIDNGRIVEGDSISIGAAPMDTEEDWVVLIKKPGYQLPVFEAEIDPIVEPAEGTDPEETPGGTSGSTTDVEIETPSLSAANEEENNSGAITQYSLFVFALMLYYRRRQFTTSRLNAD